MPRPYRSPVRGRHAEAMTTADKGPVQEPGSGDESLKI